VNNTTSKTVMQFFRPAKLIQNSNTGLITTFRILQYRGGPS